jgi:hypothetical protein
MTDNQDSEGRPIPGVVRVFGILHMVFGSFWLVKSFASLIRRLDTTSDLGESLGVGEIAIQWFRLSRIITPILSLVLLMLGIGLLLKKPWGRSGSIIHSYVAIALSIINAAVFASILLPSFTKASEHRAMAIGFIITGIVSVMSSSIYPALTIIFMSKANVKAALERRANL